jgi:acetyltransferase
LNKNMFAFEYPKQCERLIRLKDGAAVFLRPSKASDIGMLVEFYRSLSPNTRYLRFLSYNHECPVRLLIEKYKRIDYANIFALLAITAAGSARIIGDSCYVIDPSSDSAEIAIVVADDWQNRGLGTHMLLLMLEAVIKGGIKRITGEIDPHNTRIIHIMRKSGINPLCCYSRDAMHFEFNLKRLSDAYNITKSTPAGSLI